MKAACLAALALVGALVAEAGEIWVAPAGADTNAGTAEAPLATVSAALRKGREWRRLKDPAAADGVSVVLRGGTYSLYEPILLRPEDSGTATAPTRIVAARDERPIVSGGVRVVDWRPADETPAGLPAAARGHVWVAPLPMFNGRALEFRQLWVTGRKAIRARTPNGDAMERLTGWDRTARRAEFPASLALPEDLRGVEMILLQAWEIAVLRIKSRAVAGEVARVEFHDPESRVEFEHPWPQPPMPGKDGKNAAFFLANSIAYLDAPGEWFADLRAGVVYYWPRSGEDLAQAEVIAPALETLVRVAGTLDRPVEHVTVEGVEFAHTTWLRPSLLGHVPLQAGLFMTDAYALKPKGTPDWRSLDNQAWLGRPPAAIEVSGARDVRLVDCTVRHAAANGIDLQSGVRDSAVEGCVGRDIGINGVMLGAFAEGGFEAHLPYAPADDRAVVSGIRVANNLIADCANEDWGGVAIIAGFVRDTAIEHNEVRDTSYTGISLGFGWTRTPNAMRNNRVHANLLRRVATRTADNAGIYTLSNQPGTIVSENVVEPIVMSPFVHDPEHWFYLYTDEGSSFITVRDNWCPAERFLKNATGPGNVWLNNGPQVGTAIKAAAGLEPVWRERRAAELAR
ncbi:MAG: right-handed parallel beta-helix repeat-containing protein [Candidatus Didemnitutus sp.]|nr:right-handed parallel beta-helix repeat-containing protein [Candidatus Didemnitutus sp.]